MLQKYYNIKRMGVIIMLVSLLAVGAYSQSVIKGRVLDDETGQPVAKALVKYRYAYNEKYVHGVLTDARGQFEIKDIDTGSLIHLLANADGYEQDYHEVLASDSNPSEFIIQLKKSSIEQPKLRKDFKIKHRDPVEIYRLIEGYLPRNQAATFSAALRTISIHATQEQIQKIEEKILAFDVPLKKIWLEVVLIQASGNGSSKSEYPKEIETVVKKMQSLFKFGKYTILGRADAMGLEGSILSFSTGRATSSSMPSAAFQVRTKLEYIDDVISLEDLLVRVQSPRQSELTTSVNIKNGDTVILGASRGDAQKGSLITVVTVKVVE